MTTRYRLRQRFSLAIVFALGFAVPPAQAQSNPASAGALSPSVQQVAGAAAGGNAEAQYTLARMYNSGEGVPKDPATAVLWLQKAANQGHADAQYSLGTSYLLGYGVPKNTAAAVEWLVKSAQQGNALAQTNLGAMYLNGDGVAQDFRQALLWLEKAGARGQPLAQYSLGRMYQNGYGVRTDETMAAQWYARAAAQNHAPAVQALAQLKRPPASPAAAAVVAVAKNDAVAAPQEQVAVLAAVQAWAAGWSSKDVDAYLGHYAADFRTPNGESRSEWAAQRRVRIERRKRIAVTIIAPQVELSGDAATVTFTQRYVADSISETGRKTLLLARRGDAWKIVQEAAGKAAPADPGQKNR